MMTMATINENDAVMMKDVRERVRASVFETPLPIRRNAQDLFSTHDCSFNLQIKHVLPN